MRTTYRWVIALTRSTEIARMTRSMAASALSLCASGGSSVPAMRCMIAAVGGPMSLVRISAGPEKVAFPRRIGSRVEHLAALVGAVAETLEENPDFLRILIVMATQPIDARAEVRVVVNRVREMALERLRGQMEIVFGVDRAGADADHLARFALAAFDGAFVAYQSSPGVRVGGLLRHLPAALNAVRRDLAPG